MSLNYPHMGEGFAPAYQVSATPFLTSSVTVPNGTSEIEFSNITRFFTIKNTGGHTMAFGFTQAGVTGSHKFTLEPKESYEGEIRTTQIWVSGSAQTTSYCILAGLTGIPERFASQPPTGWVG